MARQFQQGFSSRKLLLIIILINSILSVNSTPALLDISSSAIWAQNATTIAGQADGTSGTSTSYLDSPTGITISNDNILYIADYWNHRVVVKNLTSSTVIRTIGSGPDSTLTTFNKPSDVWLIGAFIYVLDSQNYRIQKWTINGTNPSTLIGPGKFNYSVYFHMDKNDNLYVSVQDDNKVIRFAANSSTPITVAGNGTAGAASKTLNAPYGIFVDDNLSLFIADYNNHRIQKWTFGSSNGTTVAGTGTNGTSLSHVSYPSAVILDKNGYMYITDTGNNRIVRWGINSTSGICIAACTGISGIGKNQLYWPASLAIDSNGSLYVSEYDNNRVQKFQILSNPNTIITTIHAAQLTSTVKTASLPSKTDLLTNTALSTEVFPELTTPVVPELTTEVFPELTTPVFPELTTPVVPELTTEVLPELTTEVFPELTTEVVPELTTEVFPELTTTVSQTTLTSTTTTVSQTTLTPTATTVLQTTLTSTTTTVSQTTLTPTTTTVSQTTLTSTTTTVSQTTLTSTTTTVSQTTLTPTTTTVSQTTSPRITTTVSQTTSPGITTTVLQTTSAKTTTLQTASAKTATLQTITASITTTVLQTTSTKTTTLQTALVSTTRSSQSIDTSQMISTVNHVQTSTLPKTTIQSTSVSTATSLEITTMNPTVSSPLIVSSQMPSTHILSTKIGASSSQQISTSLPKQTISSTDILSIQSTNSVTSSTTMNTLNCSNMIISLSPNNPSMTTPMEIERSQDFSISSKLQFNCAQSFGFLKQWTIETCLNSSCSLTEQYETTLTSMTLGELFVSSKTLKYGIYQMKLTVRMSGSSQLNSSAITYIKIIPSPIQVNLIQFGPSMITQGQQQTLILDPGRFSIDPDETYFNSSNWKFTYFCRLYDFNQVPNVNDTIFSINSSCFGNSVNQSLLIIPGGSLLSNQTYQFKVQLNSIQNSSITYSGDLLVQIEDEISMTIGVKCIISTLCISENEYQMINPTTQIALTSFCIDNCYNFSSIQWNIYYGISQWTMLDNNTQDFGKNSSNFTVSKDLFVMYPTIQYWRFEVIYTAGLIRSIGLINFMVNSPPTNGSCVVYPLNGTTSTLFSITCSNWFDSDGIKDYSFYTWTSDQSNRVVLGYTTTTNFQVRMPIGDLNSTLLYLLVRVRDNFDCTTELNLSSISVIPDMNNILSLSTTIDINSNPIIYTLYSGDQNDVCQVLTSVSQVLNMMAQQNLQSVINNNVSAVSISVSSLYQEYLSINNWTLSNLTQYNHQLNTLAAIGDYLMIFINNLTVANINSIILQGSTLSQLTATTNQLTRDALIIASTRCLELSYALLNDAPISSYEDIQTATGYISQCASNVLTAVNAPLQERTIVLDLDTNRANAFPADYDTDLEYVWSNPNLFADGDDFSPETIEKNRNLYYQQQTAEIINNQFEETMLMITNALNIHLNIEQSVVFNTSSIIMSLKRMMVNTISSQTIELNNNTRIYLPSNLLLNSTNNSMISLRCVQTPLSLAGNPAQANINLSRLLSITFFDENSYEIPVHSLTEKPIEFFISRDINLPVSPMIMQNVSSIISTSSFNNPQFNLHYIDITQMNINISLSVHFEMRPLNPTLGYMLIYKFDDIPQLNSSINHIDDWSILCPENLTIDGLFIYFIDNNKTSEHQSTIFGIRELNSTEFEIYCVNISTEILINDHSFNFSTNYELRTFTSGCYYLDSNNNWQSDGLLVGSLTTHMQTQCFSSHLSTFTSGFLILPEPINWNYVFANAGFVKNKTVYLTVIMVVVIFIILSIFARHLDNKDNEKLGVTILSDNKSNDKYFYQMVTFTGIWKNAGTSAKVQFILSGDDHETDIRILSNSHRKILQRGSIDSFIFSVPKSLGLLNYMRIWHDNSGKESSPSWFLKYIIIRDLQTMEKFYFLCQQWLSIDKGDGKIERILPVSNNDQMREVVYPLTEKAYYSLSDGHLWFSIFSRPPLTKFTRVQRCICCFVLLFMVMLINILYYEQEQEAKIETRAGGVSLGPFYFSSQQVRIGFIADVLIFIPSTLLVALFRRIRQRRISHRVIEALSKLKPNEIPSIITGQKKKTKKRNPLLLPWWCVFIAYGLSFILIGISILLIIARGIEFGDMKIQKWLGSLITAFVSSVLLSQPIKVLCTAIFLAIMSRRRIDDEESNDYIDENEAFYLNGGEENIHSIEVNNNETSTRVIHRLNKAKVAEARRIRLREIEMWSYIQQLLVYAFYLIVLYAVSYVNMNPNSYNQVSHLRNFFLNTRSTTNNFMKISTVSDYWNWVDNVFVSNIHAQSWYNGDVPQDLSGFINDKSNRLIGWPVMRQLRIKPNSTCRVPISIRKFIPSCKGDYSSSNEEQQSWFPGWTLTNNISYSEIIENAFIYQSGNEINSYKYRGIEGTYDRGGYVYEFRGRLDEMQSNLTKLQQLSWIDSQTRAVLIQLTLYNPNVQLFTSSTFLLEFLSTGGVFVQSRFEPIDLHDEFQGVSSIFHVIGEIIYMVFILYFTYIEIRLLIKLKKKYFYSIWCFIQWGTIICSWSGLGIYIWRFFEGSRLRQLFQQTNGYEYINIQSAVYVDNILMFFFGFCCFFSTLKFLHLFRFNRRLSQFSQTLNYVKKDLFYFAWTFIIVFFAFIALFYLLFFSKIWSCSDVSHTAEMLFEMLLLKFNSEDLYAADMFLGPFAFTLFIYFLVFICCTMIISIINDGFRHIRCMNKTKLNEEQDVILFIFAKMKRVFGKKKNEVKGENLGHQDSKERLFDKMSPKTISSQLTTTPPNDICVEDV